MMDNIDANIEISKVRFATYTGEWKDAHRRKHIQYVHGAAAEMKVSLACLASTL